MNYNIDIDELNDEKIIIPKKNYYCSNCNKKGHTFKTCNNPIISNGIIAIYIKGLNDEIIPLLEDYLIKNLKIFTNSYNKNKISFQYNKNQNNHYWLDSYIKIKPNQINKSIQFLMVQRKNSLGYLEFMRGRYSIENLSTLTHLLEQMTPDELNNINNKDFDFLWNNLWDSNNICNKNHHKEYLNSKQKLYQLKLSHNDILSGTKPLYNFNEWGFPKGRRESYEPDLVCAIREFEEETTLNENNYTILERCKSIRENLVGTNGVDYAHNYFLSILNDNLSIVDETNKEISQAKVLNLNECLERIRPYHKNKIKIIKNVYTIINNFLLEYSSMNEHYY
jgi:ADP-ribose pyrophosphatase YjhB (NUDIX family)